MRFPAQLQHRESASSLYTTPTDNTTPKSNDYGSPGITHSSKAKNDISSIDKIHDENRNKLLITTGKQHLALYKILDEEQGVENKAFQKPSFINRPKDKQLQNIILMKDLLHNTNSVMNLPAYFGNDGISNINNNFSVSIPESLINQSKNTSHSSISPAGSFKLLNKGMASQSTSQSPSNNFLQLQKPHLSLQSRNNSTNSIKIKPLATNSDVKSGYKEFNHLVAVTNTSTTVSLYDINRLNSNSLFATIQEHTRTINSVDFHPQNSSAFIAGDMNGIAKIYDLRKLPNGSHSSSSSLSQMNSKTMSDMTIMTQQNDAIRDIKWNPVAPNIFATIHDSGTILKYDIRYTATPEKKISAHDGPGLCIHWAPANEGFHGTSASDSTGFYNNNHGNLSEYIASGGRDGKLCYWYMGDARPSLGIPESTIVVGESIYKLKFRPMGSFKHKSKFNGNGSTTPNNPIFGEKSDNIGVPNNNYDLNDMQVAISTKHPQMNSNITIYSPSRIHMPKHILATRASSTGFVWFDENHLFNVDKNNCINGFDLKKEPSMEENVGGKGLKWRDIEGDGLVFSMPIGVQSRYNSNNDVLIPNNNPLKNIEEANNDDDATIETSEKPFEHLQNETEEKQHGSSSLFERSATNSPGSLFMKQRSGLLKSSSFAPGSPIEAASQFNGLNNSHNNFIMNLKRQKKKQQQQHDSRNNSFNNSYSPIDRGGISPASSPFQQLINSHHNWTSVTSHNSNMSHMPLMEASSSIGLKKTNLNHSNQSLVYALNIPLILNELVSLNQNSFENNDTSQTTLSINKIYEKYDTSLVETFKHLAKNLSYANIQFIPLSKKTNFTSDKKEKVEIEKKEKLEREKIINDLGFHDDWLATAETHTNLDLACGSNGEQVSINLNNKNTSSEHKKNNSWQDDIREAEIKVSVADYEKLRKTCQSNSDEYFKINDLSKCKLWKLIQKSIDFHVQELLKKYEASDEDADVDFLMRTNFNDEAVADEDYDENDEENTPYTCNTDLESQNSLSKSNSFVSNLKHRASSSNYHGTSFKEQLESVTYLEDDEKKNRIKLKQAKNKTLGPAEMTELRSELLQNEKPWSLNNLLPYLYKQAQKTGDVLTSILLLLNFQQLVPLASKSNVKGAVYDFICLLHTYELFEVSAQLLKSCYFAKDILAITNNGIYGGGEDAKKHKHEDFPIETAPSDGISLSTISIDQTKSSVHICVFCEGKVYKNTTMLLKCGHVGHNECLSSWFSSMGSLCPSGCVGKLL
ncbi:hypothetical protein QEN19_004006 [Hanseniaspora menglaensis]